MDSRAADASEREDVPLWTLARRGLTAASIAVIANVALVFGAARAGVAPDLAPLAIEPVVRWTVVGTAGATVVYGLCDRASGSPDRLFRRIAAVVLLLSLVPDAVYVPRLPGATASGAAFLGFLHVTTAAVAVWLLPTDTTPAWLGGE